VIIASLAQTFKYGLYEDGAKEKKTNGERQEKKKARVNRDSRQ
jgi:hypothetical protein